MGVDLNSKRKTSESLGFVIYRLHSTEKSHAPIIRRESAPNLVNLDQFPSKIEYTFFFNVILLSTDRRFLNAFHL
jgi:hypothetical protein